MVKLKQYMEIEKLKQGVVITIGTRLDRHLSEFIQKTEKAIKEL